MDTVAVVSEPEVPEQPPEDVPEPAIGSKLNSANVRYCLYQQVRLEGVGPLTAKTDLTIYSSLVNDWNARCALARYSPLDQDAVNGEIIDRRRSLEAEGLALMTAWRRKLQNPGQEAAIRILPDGSENSIAPSARPQASPLPSLITGQPTDSGGDGDGGQLKAPTLMLLHAYVAARVQKRLSELGYANNGWDGTLGPAFSQCFAAFQTGKRVALGRCV